MIVVGRFRQRLKQYRKQHGKRYRRWRGSLLASRLRAIAERPRFARIYLLSSLLVLGGTTLLWSLLGAQLQQSNADQLSNAYLFQGGDTFHGAFWPNQHTFILKWPLFLLVKLIGYGTVGFIGVTVGLVLITVGLLAWLLWRLERRPLVLGTIYLMLASVLLLIPAQPYAGGLLPVNMAMLTTRNLEYMVYIAALYYVTRLPSLGRKSFYAATLLLGLLIASDRLFLSITVVAAAAALIAYALRERWELVKLTTRWLMIAVSAIVLAVSAVSLMTAGHWTHVVSEGLAGPYGVANNFKSVITGIVYAVGGLLTNFGANPAFDAVTFRQIVPHLYHHFFSVAGPAYLVNAIVCLMAFVLGGGLLFRSLWPAKKTKLAVASQDKLTLLLVWSTLAAGLLFVASNHYYAVDARYLTLALFTGFVVIAAWSRPHRIHEELILLCLPLLILGIAGATWSAVTTSHTQRLALSVVDQRNATISKVLLRHKVDVLVGDYWRVMPTKFQTGGKQTVLPLGNCAEPRRVLTSQTWQPDLRHHSFAYLLTFQGNLTDYPQCDLRQTVATYGLPNSSALIAGTLAHPQEILLFYDQGIRQPAENKSPTAAEPATVIPISLSDLPHTNCTAPTIMNVVAHQDDDLLFMNPDLLHSLKSDYCVRTVYMTAGDAGYDQLYWLGREQGSEAAYQSMIGHQISWLQRIVRLPGGQFITIANPRGNDKISLIFMHLPDGNLDGQGFAASRYQSLASLSSGRIKDIATVDHQSRYSSAQLTTALTDLISIYHPAEIRAQSNFDDGQFPDHSDHRSAGTFVAKAHKDYEARQFAGLVSVPLVFYKGYTVHELPPNVSDGDLAAKEAAFMAYAAFDGGVCHSIEDCRQVPTYGSYMDRQYTNPY